MRERKENQYICANCQETIKPGEVANEIPFVGILCDQCLDQLKKAYSKSN